MPRLTTQSRALLTRSIVVLLQRKRTTISKEQDLLEAERGNLDYKDSETAEIPQRPCEEEYVLIRVARPEKKVRLHNV